MNKIPFVVNLTVYSNSNELSPEAEQLLIAEDCARMCADLFWLVEQIAADAEASESEEFLFRAEETPKLTLEDVQLLKSISSVARLGCGITARLQTVIAQIDDYTRRNLNPTQ